MKRACNVAVTPVDSDSSHLRDGFDTLTLVERSLFARMLFFHCERREHPERPLFFFLDEAALFLPGEETCRGSLPKAANTGSASC